MYMDRTKLYKGSGLIRPIFGLKIFQNFWNSLLSSSFTQNIKRQNPIVHENTFKIIKFYASSVMLVNKVK